MGLHKENLYSQKMTVTVKKIGCTPGSSPEVQPQCRIAADFLVNKTNLLIFNPLKKRQRILNIEKHAYHSN